MFRNLNISYRTKYMNEGASYATIMTIDYTCSQLVDYLASLLCVLLLCSGGSIMAARTNLTTHVSARPVVVLLVAVLTGIFTFRILAIFLGFQAVRGAIPLIFAIGGFGDFIAGISAPFIVWRLLKQPNLTSWALALMWHTYSFCDFVFGNAAHTIATGGLTAGFDGTLQPTPPAQWVLIAVFICCNLAALGLLLSARVRTYIQQQEQR